MREVAFFHRASRILILVDLIEHFTPATPGTNLFLRIAFRAFGMWNRPSRHPSTGSPGATGRGCARAWSGSLHGTWSA